MCVYLNVTRYAVATLGIIFQTVVEIIEIKQLTYNNLYKYVNGFFVS